MSVNITLKGNPVKTVGNELKVGDTAPDFHLQGQDMSEKKLSDTNGKIRILNFVPSLDTPVCDKQARTFNERAAGIPGVETFVISVDLPMAAKRWCAGAGIQNLTTLSAHRDATVGKDYGLLIEGGPLDRFMARAVFVVDQKGVIQYAQYVPEIGEMPDIEAPLAKAKELAGN